MDGRKGDGEGKDGEEKKRGKEGECMDPPPNNCETVRTLVTPGLPLILLPSDEKSGKICQTVSSVVRCNLCCTVVFACDH